MTALQYHLYSKAEYFQKLVQLFDNTFRGDRILLMSMAFDPRDQLVSKVMESLEAAAQRGVTVHFSIDARVFLEVDGFIPGPLWFSPTLSGETRGKYGKIYTLLDRLNDYETCRAVITNRPDHRFSLPVAGRSHIKAAIVNDQAFVGGCNLDSSTHIDLMTGWRDKQTADDLYGVLSRCVTTGNVREALAGVDRTIPLDTTTSLFIDAGVRHQSLILKNAMELIDAAQRWLVFSCQYFPNSSTAQHLLRARERGVHARLAYSNIKLFKPIGRAIQHVNRIIEHFRVPRDMFKGELPPQYPFMHAKLIACDQGTMIGSHNYVLPGVQMGTAEIALKSTDPAFAERAAEKLSSQLRDYASSSSSGISKLT